MHCHNSRCGVIRFLAAGVARAALEVAFSASHLPIVGLCLTQHDSFELLWVSCVFLRVP